MFPSVQFSREINVDKRTLLSGKRSDYVITMATLTLLLAGRLMNDHTWLLLTNINTFTEHRQKNLRFTISRTIKINVRLNDCLQVEP